MRSVSRKRQRERPQREAAIAAVIERDGEGCFAFRQIMAFPMSKIPPGTPITCAGPLDAHEVIQRSVYPGGHLDPANIRMVCRRHHSWLDTDASFAHELGLFRFSWERA